MTWRKHFRLVNVPSSVPSSNSALPAGRNSGGVVSGSKFSSYLPEVYAGHPNRLQRYQQYDDMDRDSTINAALDTISDFCTQSEEQNDQPFQIRYNESANETEVKIIKASLEKWTKLNDFRARLWYVFRGVIKNGDQFFVRDPETKEWQWVDHYNVDLVHVDEAQGKKPLEYVIRNLDYNKQQKLATKPSNQESGLNGVELQRGPIGQASGSTFQLQGTGRSLTSQQSNESHIVDAKHVVHLSLSVGMDANWPFGASILEGVFRTFKQKELLEDAVIIYRVQRAPERRIFKIDVGSMNPVMANAHIERIKNEIHQRRIPNRTGGGNSIMDAAYNPLCLSMDTRVPLLDGRTLSITELAAEHQAGKENWVYSCDPVTGAIVPGNITWAGVTRKNAKVLKVTLDNGESVIMTPDHKVPVLGKGFVEAKDLTSSDSLISYETRLKSLGENPNSSYQQVYDHKEQAWKFTHRVVSEFFRDKNKHQEFTFCEEFLGAVKNTVHHKDYDRYNNDPRNLTWMNFEDHRLFHTHVKKEYWETIDPIERNRLVRSIKASLASTLANQTLEEKQQFALACPLEQQERWKNVDHTTKESKLLSWSKLKKLCSQYGYKNWTDFKKKIPVYNHRITSIEWMDERIDTGCITIDGPERWHNHHTFAVEAGIFVKNSMMEDYFFAQSAEGRGSTVETLPGGEQTGETGDLDFFDKKLKAGLRIPQAYLPGGDQDSSYNDGKLGSAMIQEYMFNKYCMRLQALLAPVFDREFKLFLKDNGIQIEEGLFELMFNPPQNFTKYRQIELDSQQMNVYSQIADNKRLAERFKLKRFLNLTQEEILENERLWREENPRKVKAATGSTEMGGGGGGGMGGLGDVGIRSGEEGDFAGDGSDTEAIGDETGGADLGGDAGANIDADMGDGEEL